MLTCGHLILTIPLGRNEPPHVQPNKEQNWILNPPLSDSKLHLLNLWRLSEICKYWFLKYVRVYFHLLKGVSSWYLHKSVNKYHRSNHSIIPGSRKDVAKFLWDAFNILQWRTRLFGRNTLSFKPQQSEHLQWLNFTNSGYPISKFFLENE